MKYIVFFIMIGTFLGCGGNNDTQATDDTNPALSSLTQKESTTKTLKTLTLYIHGYAKDGYKADSTYGKDTQEAELSGIIQATGFSTTQNYDKEQFKNLFAIASYYGNTPPSYYSQQDIQEVEALEGIPRYAHIMAKYAKHIMKESGANTLNLMSVSMGSLVTRYLIEKDLEHLASEKKIKKWLSIEGVIQGNVAASSSNLLNTIEIFDKQAPEVDHMDYGWVRNHLDLNNPYYHDIQVGFESSTDDDANKGALSFWLLFNGNFRANDGVQLVEDTLINDPRYTHTYYHDNHYTLADNRAAWGYATTFLLPNKRVKITLLDATISVSTRKKVQFQSAVFSQKAQDKWHFVRAIDERLFEGRNLPRFRYQTSESKTLNQELFDSYILKDEESLTLEVQPLGLEKVRLALKVKEGVYPLQGSDWSGHVRVEILP